MTDDYSPIELSFSWKPSDSVPRIRYSVEPIGRSAGTTSDPLNVYSSAELVQKLHSSHSHVNLEWYRHFFRELLVPSLNHANLKVQKQDAHPSQIFLAFDLKDESTMPKVYFVPTLKAEITNESRFSIVASSMAKLALSYPTLQDQFSMVSDYLHTFPTVSRPEVEIVAIDCVDPSFSRIKVYLRSRQTSFDSVIDMLSLGGRVKMDLEKGLSELEELWRLVLGLDEGFDKSQPLHFESHRTSGVLYYVELGVGRKRPKTKLYIPAKHYARNDYQVAFGLSTFLKARGKRLADGAYLEGAMQLW